MPSRREFLLTAGSAAALSSLPALALFATNKRDINALYDRAVVIDALGGPGEPFRN